MALLRRRGVSAYTGRARARTWQGAAGLIHCSPAKGGVVGFTRALGRELGPSGIRVNALAPGRAMNEACSAHGAAHPEHAGMIRSRRALRRDAVAEDPAGPASFLASEVGDCMARPTILVEGCGRMW